MNSAEAGEEANELATSADELAAARAVAASIGQSEHDKVSCLAGLNALTDAIRAGALPKCTDLTIGMNAASEEAVQACEAAIKNRH